MIISLFYNFSDKRKKIFNIFEKYIETFLFLKSITVTIIKPGNINSPLGCFTSFFNLKSISLHIILVHNFQIGVVILKVIHERLYNDEL